MSDISAAEWEEALISIIEDLDKGEYRKLLGRLDKIPKSHKDKNREDLPHMIIKYYGLEGSIAVIDDAMKQIPRQDPKMQDLLQPFVEELKAKDEEKKNKCEHLCNKSVVMNIFHFSHIIIRLYMTMTF